MSEAASALTHDKTYLILTHGPWRTVINLFIEGAPRDRRARPLQTRAAYRHVIDTSDVRHSLWGGRRWRLPALGVGPRSGRPRAPPPRGGAISRSSRSLPGRGSPLACPWLCLCTIAELSCE